MLPTARTLIARHRWAYWAIVLALGGLVANAVVAAHGQARAAQAAWGEARSVWIARDDLDAGDVVVAELVERPLAMLPEGTFDAAVDPNGMTAAQAVRRGEVLTSADTRRDGVAGFVAGGDIAITVAASPLPPVALGDPVTVYGINAPLADGHVVHIDAPSSAITVAVPAGTAAPVVEAVTAGVAVIALRSP
jgi:hypothetical protein